MSAGRFDVIDRDVGTGFMQAAIPLLKEYTEKLNSGVREAGKLLDRAETSNSEILKERLKAVADRLGQLAEAVDGLDRRVSQMIEHGRLDFEIDRVELELRLNELEAAKDEALEIARISDLVR